MNYEEKYKDALDLARTFYEGYIIQEHNGEAGILAEIFPELKESEDERIRKAIMSCCIDHGSKYKYLGVSMEEMCAWLEKQGKKLDADEVIGWLEKHYLTTPNGGYYYLPKDCIKQFKKDFGL